MALTKHQTHLIYILHRAFTFQPLFEHAVVMALSKYPFSYEELEDGDEKKCLKLLTDWYTVEEETQK